MQLPEPVPAFCTQCGWDLKNDLTFGIFLDLPDAVIEEYRQRVGIARTNWNAGIEAVRKQAELEKKLNEQSADIQLLKEAAKNHVQLEEKLKQMEAEMKRMHSENEQNTSPAKGQPSSSGKTERIRSENESRDQRFTANGDGAVYDRKLNLTWAATDNGSNVTWQQTYDYCKNYKGGGWRMPTQDELHSLVGKKNGVTKGFDCWPNGDNYIITGLIRLTCFWVWAAEKAGSSGACVHFGSGFRYWGRMDTPLGCRALPVRSGK